jgi:membrane protein insertase Oxa1/YidC/SpoIIIJ
MFTIHLPSALSLYWLVSGLVAFTQQTIILRDDTTEMEASASQTKPAEREKKAIEAEIVQEPAKKKASKKNARKKRRK